MTVALAVEEPDDALLSELVVSSREAVLLPFFADVLLAGDVVARASVFCFLDPPDSGGV